MYCLYLQIEIRVIVLSNTVKLDFLCLQIPPSPLFRSTRYMERKHVDWEVGDQFESRLLLNVVFFTFYLLPQFSCSHQLVMYLATLSFLQDKVIER